MNIKDLRKLSTTKLKDRAVKRREELAAHRRGYVVSTDTNVKKRKALKRELARILTILNEDQHIVASDRTQTKEESDG